MLDEFNTLKEEKYEGVITAKKSEFIAHLYKVSSQEEVDKAIGEVRKKYSDATHNVPAYRFYDIETNSVIERCSDDGEPSSTSGKPMLDILKFRDLTNILIVVTRYFGGTLLGTGGLVKAYSDALKEVLDKAEFITVKNMMHFNITVTYDDLSMMKMHLENTGCIIENIKYGIDVSFDIYIDNSNEDKLNNLLSQFYDSMIVKKLKNTYK